MCDVDLDDQDMPAPGSSVAATGQQSNGSGLRYGSPSVASISQSALAPAEVLPVAVLSPCQASLFLSPVPAPPVFPVCGVYRFVESLPCPMPLKPL